MIPYSCVYIDASFTDIFDAASRCVTERPERSNILHQLEEIWTTENNPNHVLPTLSVRTALDLFLRVKNFPPGSEIIASAINIPDMIRVIHHHKLRVVSLDVELETLSPKLDLLESLITDKTKILLLAHIYGKRFDVAPFIEIAHQHGIFVIEDIAEAFEGFEHLGHPLTDLALFSFGVIKVSTAFGGAVSKIKDKQLFLDMAALYHTYPVQRHSEYLKKVVKYFFIAMLLNVPLITKTVLNACYFVGFDIKGYVVSKLRGFPDHLVDKLRHQPCTALLQTMEQRFKHFNAAGIAQTNARGDYMTERLPENVTPVGNKAMKSGYWLFPVVVNNPDEVLQVLNRLGVDAYRGATQLSIVTPDNGDPHDTPQHATRRFPHEAKYLIDHVIYLPVSKHVPFSVLDKICEHLETAVRICDEKRLPLVKNPPVKVLSKL